MKLTPRPNRSSGHLILVFVLFVAIVAILWVGYKIIDHLQRHAPDPWHGQDTNDITQIDYPFTNIVAALKATMPSNSLVEITLPIEFKNAKVLVPVEALARKWYWETQSSSNFVDWVATDLGWEEAQAINSTNHPGHRGYFRRVIIW